MNKIFLIVTVLLTSAHASNNLSEEAFVKGHLYELKGQDSLACIYYKEALKYDSSSIELRELLGRALLRLNNTDEALINLRQAAKAYSEKNRWYEAFLAYKDIYHITQYSASGPSDGALLASFLFRDGIEKNDSSEIKAANKIWDSLLNEAVLKDNMKVYKNLLDARELLKTTPTQNMKRLQKSDSENGICLS